MKYVFDSTYALNIDETYLIDPIDGRQYLSSVSILTKHARSMGCLLAHGPLTPPFTVHVDIIAYSFYYLPNTGSSANKKSNDVFCPNTHAHLIHNNVTQVIHNVYICSSNT